LVEFRARRYREVRCSSKEHRLFGKNCKKTTERLFCFSSPPILSKFGGLWLPVHYLGCRAERWAPNYKNIKPGSYLLISSTSLHSSIFCFCFALRKDNLAKIFRFLPMCVFYSGLEAILQM
jgi:hypothetical protein